MNVNTWIHIIVRFVNFKANSMLCRQMKGLLLGDLLDEDYNRSLDMLHTHNVLYDLTNLDVIVIQFNK